MADLVRLDECPVGAEVEKSCGCRFRVKGRKMTSVQVEVLHECRDHLVDLSEPEPVVINVAPSRKVLFDAFNHALKETFS